MRTTINIQLIPAFLLALAVASEIHAQSLSTVNNSWFIDISPHRGFEQSHGTIPSGAGDKAGRPNLAAVHIETVADDKALQLPMHLSSPQFISSTAVEWGKTRAPYYLYNTAPLRTDFIPLRRVADPKNPAKWAYQHRITFHDFAAYRMQSGTPAPDSIRSEVLAVGDDRFVSWGTEEIAVFAILINDQWKRIPQSGEWSAHFQFHDSTGGLTGNPSFALYWNGGGSNPSASYWNAALRAYDYTPREYAADPNRVGNRVIASRHITNPSSNTWHYFIAHYRTGAGPYRDPATGTYPYGSRNPDDVFFRLYHAVGDGSPRQILNHSGFWASPHEPSSNSKSKPGYWKTGIYMNSDWRSNHDERILYTKGFRVWRVQDVRGLTPALALQAFKAQR